jgi:hypothetical protein
MTKLNPNIKKTYAYELKQYQKSVRTKKLKRVLYGLTGILVLLLILWPAYLHYNGTYVYIYTGKPMPVAEPSSLLIFIGGLFIVIGLKRFYERNIK